MTAQDTYESKTFKDIQRDRNPALDASLQPSENEGRMLLCCCRCGVLMQLPFLRLT
jgi:hypothetical protein